MTDYTKLVDSLRHLSTGRCHDSRKCELCAIYETCLTRCVLDAADAIEALQAEVERLKDSNEELREKQTYIDHYGNTWMTSGKDVPAVAYKHGYADGWDEAMAKMEVQDD